MTLISKVMIKRIFIILFFIKGVSSCVQEASCDEAAESVRNDYCNIIVVAKGSPGYQLSLKGADAKSKKVTKFQRGSYSWSFRFEPEIAIGDTVVKNKGELKFYVHKKDTVLIFPFECKGKIYK
jgi:hypothetical protein